MPLFSFKRSSAADSDSSSASSLPLNDSQDPESVPEQPNERKTKSVLGRLRGSVFLGPGIRHGRRSKSPINRSARRRSRSPFQKRGYSPPPRPRLTEEKFLPPPTFRRLGTSFCLLCDMRIATCMLNTIHVAVAVVMEVVEARKWGNRNYIEEPPILLLLAIGISGMGLLGAIHFLRTPLMLSSICFCFLCFLYTVNVYMIRVVLVVMIISTQAILSDEIRRGIMHEDTYRYEEYIDPEGRMVIETVRGLSVDVGETAAEFAEEIQIEVRRQSSRGSELVKNQKVQNC